jgi:hypothetical protein
VFVKPLVSTPPARGLSLLGLLLCVVAWAAEITGGAHETGVRHVRCIEHGELTHPPRREVASLAVRAVAVTAHLVVAADEGAPSEGGHDHCALAALLTQAVGPTPPQPGLAACLVTSAPRLGPPRTDTGPAAGAPLLGLAPKTSPPGRLVARLRVGV